MGSKTINQMIHLPKGGRVEAATETRFVYTGDLGFCRGTCANFIVGNPD
jgi:hypothetical protein